MDDKEYYESVMHRYDTYGNRRQTESREELVQSMPRCEGGRQSQRDTV